MGSLFTAAAGGDPMGSGDWIITSHTIEYSALALESLHASEAIQVVYWVTYRRRLLQRAGCAAYEIVSASAARSSSHLGSRGARRKVAKNSTHEATKTIDSSQLNRLV